MGVRGALAAIALVAIVPARAAAQACCSAASAITPGRLAMHETALVGERTTFTSLLGQWDVGGHYLGAPARSPYDEVEEDFFATVRLFERGELTLLLPTIANFRSTPGPPALHDHAIGLGDAQLGGRWTFVRTGSSTTIPGISLLASITAPTGRPADESKASHPLAADVTGVGAWQGALGATIEQSFGPWLVTTTLSLALPRKTRGIDESLGVIGSVLGAVAYTFPANQAIALSAAYTAETNGSIGGVSTTGYRTLLVALGGIVPIDDAWKVQLGVSLNPPISELGRNQLVDAGAFVSILRGWS